MRLAPLWVYFFGFFAVAVTQRWLFPPSEHSVAFNVLFFLGGVAAVAVVITVLERTVKER